MSTGVQDMGTFDRTVDTLNTSDRFLTGIQFLDFKCTLYLSDRFYLLTLYFTKVSLFIILLSKWIVDRCQSILRVLYNKYFVNVYLNFK